MNTYLNTKCNYKLNNEFECFFEDNSVLIKNVIKKFMYTKYRDVSPFDIDEVFQEVAFKIIKNGYIYKYSSEKSSLNTWLYIICRSVSIDYMRKRISLCEDASEIDDVVAPEAKEIDFTVPGGLLSKRQAEVLQMIFWGDLKAVEVAEQLGIKARTVRCIKHQAINKLRRHFAADRERRVVS